MRRRGLWAAALLAGAVALLGAGQADASHSEVSHGSDGFGATPASVWSADSSITEDRVFHVQAAAADEEPSVDDSPGTHAGAWADARISGFLPAGTYRATAVFRDLTGSASSELTGTSGAYVDIVALCQGCAAGEYRTYPVVTSPVGGSVDGDQVIATHDFRVFAPTTVTLEAGITAGAASGVFAFGPNIPTIGARAGSASVELTGKIAIIDVYAI